MTPHLQLRLRCIRFLWALLTAVIFVLPAGLAYDGKDQADVAYDGSRESTIGCDLVLEHAPDETREGKTGDRVLFAKFVKFLAAKGIPRVTEQGLARVESHLDDVLRNQFPEFSRADQLSFQAGERGMLDRLRSGATSSQDIEFYMHELKESARFRATGNLPDSHNAALQWRGVTSQDLFHPEVIRANPSVFSPSWQP